MGTKENPGRFDCYSAAAPDEPMFVLLARDPLAPILVREWARRREETNPDPEKEAEARACAIAMERYFASMKRVADPDLPLITLYSDGCITKNPGGIGGWGYCGLVDGDEVTDCGAVPNTTNNRMELLAIIKGLGGLRHCGCEGRRVLVVSDSQYVVRGITEHLPLWKRRQWVTRGGTPVLNRDLWEELESRCAQFATTFRWVKGHNGDHYNELCDLLAQQGVDSYRERKAG